MVEVFGITLPISTEGLVFITLALGIAIGGAAGGYLLRRGK